MNSQTAPVKSKFNLMGLVLPLMLCACSSPPQSGAPLNVAPRVIHPLSKAAKQQQPSVPYLLRAKQNSERWQKQLQSTSAQDSSAKASSPQ